MSKAGIQVQYSIKEIYAKLCPKCKEEIRKLIKEKVTDELVNEVIK